MKNAEDADSVLCGCGLILSLLHFLQAGDQFLRQAFL